MKYSWRQALPNKSSGSCLLRMELPVVSAYWIAILQMTTGLATELDYNDLRLNNAVIV
jgi:hypothetical protein